MVNQINLEHAIRSAGSVSVAEQFRPQSTGPAAEPQVNFTDVLRNELGRDPKVKLSAHAQRRIEARNIPFGTEETRRLEQAVAKAEQKGSRESLVLMDDLALVVSIKNKVVITAVDASHRKNDVFTNIDSVVLS